MKRLIEVMLTLRAYQLPAVPAVQQVDAAAEKINAAADTVIVLWMGGGMAHTETFDPAGALTVSSYFCGTLQDVIGAIAVGEDGDVYLGGRTQSADFPTANAHQPQNKARGYADLPTTETGFVARFNSASNRLVF